MTRKIAFGLVLIWAGALSIGAGLFLANRAAAGGMDDWSSRVIRLHVVAHSDADEDQALKRAVRDAILSEVTPLFEGARSQSEAAKKVKQASPQIQEAAEDVVAAWGKRYSIKVQFGRFAFPGKAYGSVFLPAGEYTALRVLIGDAEGANWWCVLFPPICFVDWSTGIVMEPKPGTDGRETIKVVRAAAVSSQRQMPVLVEQELVSQAPVKARFAIVEWWKRQKRMRHVFHLTKG